MRVWLNYTGDSPESTNPAGAGFCNSWDSPHVRYPRSEDRLRGPGKLPVTFGKSPVTFGHALMKELTECVRIPSRSSAKLLDNRKVLRYKSKWHLGHLSWQEE